MLPQQNALKLSALLISHIGFLALMLSCHPRSEQSSLQTVISKEEMIYQLGIHKGRVLEKKTQYQKALQLLKDQRIHLDANFTTMPSQEIQTLQALETVLEEQLKILESTPVHDAVKTVNSFKTNLERSVRAIRLIEGLEPIFADYIHTVEVFGQIHTAFFTLMSEIGAIIPFVNLAVRLADQVWQDHVNMQTSIANATLYESIAEFAVNKQPFDLTMRKMGLLDTTITYNRYFEYWSTVDQGRRFLHAITGQYPPIVSWSCTFCTRDINNLANEGTEKFREYLEVHARQIYITIDELRISQGGKSFPLFGGPRSWMTETGGSRKWRKPQILAQIDQKILYLENLSNLSGVLISTFDQIADNLKTSNP